MAIRITGGRLGRRIIKVPQNGVRPTQDRVRAAVFSALAEALAGARVLDLFAGSGALGLEAYSRGAAKVWWVESNRQALAVLKDNIRQLCGAEAAAGSEPGRSAPETRLVADDVWHFLRQAPVGGEFDIIFADPPYDREGAWLKKILCALTPGSILTDSGLLVVEIAARCPVDVLPGWRLLQARVYGETRVCVLRPERGLF
jgi:16S rRNA (guanine966-N2)-methyltransferase